MIELIALERRAALLVGREDVLAGIAAVAVDELIRQLNGAWGFVLVVWVATGHQSSGKQG